MAGTDVALVFIIQKIKLQIALPNNMPMHVTALQKIAFIESATCFSDLPWCSIILKSERLTARNRAFHFLQSALLPA